MKAVDWRKIPIARFDLNKGEQMAHACANALVSTATEEKSGSISPS